MDDKHADTDRSVTQSNESDDESRSRSSTAAPTHCEITLCGLPARERVEHPQRGEMVVCEFHARRIKALPKWRFIGAADRWPEVAR